MQKRKKRKEIKTTVNQRRPTTPSTSESVSVWVRVSESVFMYMLDRHPSKRARGKAKEEEEKMIKVWWRVICSSCSANLCVSIQDTQTHTAVKTDTHTHTCTAKQDNIGYSHVLAMFDGFGEINKWTEIQLCTLKEGKKGVWKKSKKARVRERKKKQSKNILELNQF